MIWNGRWPTRNKTAWMHLSSNKKGSEKLGLLAIAWDKRMWVSRPKFSWQFLILSLCASGSWWLLAGGWGIWCDWGPWSRLQCPPHLPALWYDTASHPTWKGNMWVVWGSCAVGTLRINVLGELLHTMPVNVCLLSQQLDLASCPMGDGGNAFHLLKLSPSSVLTHTHSMGCNQPPASREWEMKTYAVQISSVCSFNGIFQFVCYFSSMVK